MARGNVPPTARCPMPAGMGPEMSIRGQREVIVESNGLKTQVKEGFWEEKAMRHVKNENHSRSLDHHHGNSRGLGE